MGPLFPSSGLLSVGTSRTCHTLSPENRVGLGAPSRPQRPALEGPPLPQPPMVTRTTVTTGQSCSARGSRPTFASGLSTPSLKQPGRVPAALSQGTKSTGDQRQSHPLGGLGGADLQDRAGLQGPGDLTL